MKPFRIHSIVNPSVNKIFLLVLLLMVFQVFEVWPQSPLDPEALSQSQKFFGEKYRRCGDSYYYKYSDRGYYLYQCKYSPTITVDGKTNPPRRLSEAVLLNGVDPLPVSWEGLGRIKFNVCRLQFYGSSDQLGFDSWGPWKDTFTDSIWFEKRKQSWAFYNEPRGDELNGKKVILPVDCSEIPSESKVTPTGRISWMARSDGSYEVTLPASLDSWVSLGYGPLSIYPRSPYSKIYLDGTSNHWTIYGATSGMQPNVGVKNSRALSPNTQLGTVVGRLGKNGEPFELFSSTANAGMKYFNGQTAEEVFVAINDSYFSDNRGEHVIVVKGSKICPQCHESRSSVDSTLNQEVPMAKGSYLNFVEPPSAEFESYARTWGSVGVPINWRSFSYENHITFAPKGGYGQKGITHGAMVGLFQGESNLRVSTKGLAMGFVDENSYLKIVSEASLVEFGGQTGYTIKLKGRSPVTLSNEVVTIYTTAIANKMVLFVCTVTPESEVGTYEKSFANLLNSIQIKE